MVGLIIYGGTFNQSNAMGDDAERAPMYSSGAASAGAARNEGSADHLPAYEQSNQQRWLAHRAHSENIQSEIDLLVNQLATLNGTDGTTSLETEISQLETRIAQMKEDSKIVDSLYEKQGYHEDLSPSQKESLHQQVGTYWKAIVTDETNGTPQSKANAEKNVKLLYLSPAGYAYRIADLTTDLRRLQENLRTNHSHHLSDTTTEHSILNEIHRLVETKVILDINGFSGRDSGRERPFFGQADLFNIMIEEFGIATETFNTLDGDLAYDHILVPIEGLSPVIWDKQIPLGEFLKKLIDESVNPIIKNFKHRLREDSTSFAQLLEVIGGDLALKLKKIKDYDAQDKEKYEALVNSSYLTRERSLSSSLSQESAAESSFPWVVRFLQKQPAAVSSSHAFFKILKQNLDLRDKPAMRVTSPDWHKYAFPHPSGEIYRFFGTIEGSDIHSWNREDQVALGSVISAMALNGNIPADLSDEFMTLVRQITGRHLNLKILERIKIKFEEEIKKLEPLTNSSGQTSAARTKFVPRKKPL